MSKYLISRAGSDDIMHIHDMAEIVFRHTYKDILSPEQMEYMMDWMYSPENLQKQLEDGHVYHIAFRGNVPCGYVMVSLKREGSSIISRRFMFFLQNKVED